MQIHKKQGKLRTVIDTIGTAVSGPLYCLSKFIKLIPYHHTRIAMLLPTIDSELTMSVGGTQSGKDDPFLPCREGRGIG